MYNKKGQTFSVEILVVIIILLFSVTFLVINRIGSLESESADIGYEKAEQNAENVKAFLEARGVIDSEGNIELSKLAAIDESEFRNQLAVEGDVALVFKKEGMLVRVSPEKGIDCMGSEDVLVNDAACEWS